jgi:hypothetical protein
MTLTLTEEMIAAINRVAERKGNSPETVLRRAIFTYTGKFDRPAEKPDMSNVVSLRGERDA